MRRIGSFSMLLLYVVVFLAMFAAPAGAGVEGPCTRSFNGIPFDDLDTPSEARERLIIPPDESVLFYAAVQDTDYAYVDILFPPLTITLFSGESDEPSEQDSEIHEIGIELPLGEFSQYGAGIFQFVARTDDCRGNAYFIIGGVEPWETAVGKTAIGIAGVGVLIGLTSWIPAIVAGGGGIIRSVMAGAPIGIGVAIVAQQAGMVPLSATSAGIAVVGSSVVAIFVTRGLGAISGALTGVGTASGAALPTPPPTLPSPASVGAPAGGPPPPAETPMPPAQGAPAPAEISAQGAELTPEPEKIFIDDATLLGGETTPVPDATLTPELPEVPVQDATPTDGAPTPTEAPLAPAQSTPPPAAPGSTSPPPGDHTAASDTRRILRRRRIRHGSGCRRSGSSRGCPRGLTSSGSTETSHGARSDLRSLLVLRLSAD